MYLFVIAGLLAQLNEVPMWEHVSLLGGCFAAVTALVTRTIVPGSAVVEQRKAFEITVVEQRKAFESSVYEQKKAYDSGLLELKKLLEETRRNAEEERRENEQVRKDRDMWATTAIQTVQAGHALAVTMREMSGEQAAVARYLGKRLEGKIT